MPSALPLGLKGYTSVHSPAGLVYLLVARSDVRAQLRHHLQVCAVRRPGRQQSCVSIATLSQLLR